MMPFIGNSLVPDGWLFCRGQALSESLYSELYGLLGHDHKQLGTLNSRTSDSGGTLDLDYSSHGLNAPITLSLSFSLAPATISAVNTSTEVITTSANHMFDTGDRVQVSSTATLPGGLTASTDYYVQKISATELKLHTSPSDATNNTNPINLTSAGTGTRTMSPQDLASRAGVSIDSVAGTVLTISGGTGHSLPIAGSSITVDCGSGYFFLLNMSGRVPVGAGQGPGLTNRDLASSFGEEEHQLTTAELPSHNHSLGSNAPYRVPYNHPNGISDSGGGSASIHNLSTTLNTGSNQAHNNMQPSFVLNFIIKI
jgi:microcystin-dependent protein